jgi:hypothetical protein
VAAELLFTVLPGLRAEGQDGAAWSGLARQLPLPPVSGAPGWRPLAAAVCRNYQELLVETRA